MDQFRLLPDILLCNNAELYIWRSRRSMFSPIPRHYMIERLHSIIIMLKQIIQLCFVLLQRCEIFFDSCESRDA